MKKARVAVIAAGGIAEGVHLPSLAEIEEAEVVAICDLIVEKAEAMAKQYGIPAVYKDMYEMLDKEKPDCVFVLVEPDRLFRAAADCLRRGFHVILEKPAGTSSHQINHLARLAEKENLICAVAMNRRHIPLI